MTKLLPLLLLMVATFHATFQLHAQTIQGTLLFGSNPEEVILRIRNNSASAVAGNVTKVQFTLGMYFGSQTPEDGLTFMSVYTLPTNTGAFSSSSFMNFGSNYLKATWMGSKAVDLDPGEEMDFVGFTLKVQSWDDPSGFSSLAMYYADPMFVDNRDWIVELGGVNLAAGGDTKFYSSGPTVTVSNSPGSASVRLTTFNAGSLPVKLAAFRATKEGMNVHLKWVTSEEINSDYFLIEHSQDAKRWDSIGRIESFGESKESRAYDFTHPSGTPGLQYYRLKMVDMDGTFAYSKILDVRIEDGEENAIYPNPANDAITFTKALAHGAKVRILDTSGKVRSIHSNASGTIQLGHLSSGQFFVEVETDSKIQVKRYKVIKK